VYLDAGLRFMSNNYNTGPGNESHTAQGIPIWNRQWFRIQILPSWRSGIASGDMDGVMRALQICKQCIQG
jgi:hypothetical protein